MNKFTKSLFIACSLLFVFFAPQKADAATQKVGVLFSQQSEDFMFASNVGGTHQPPLFSYSVSVDPKGKYGSAMDKAIRMYSFYKEKGYDVQRISDSDLKNLATLNTYDAIVLPYAVMLNHTQRENVRRYVYGGGNAQFIFATARNEADKFEPNPKKMDLSPLIYDVLTYIWEWDNLTETLQSTFRDDIILTDMTITNTKGSTHPILQNAYKLTGRNNITLKESGDEWIESIALWPTKNAQSILTFADFSLKSYTPERQAYKSKYITKGETPALTAVQYGEGRLVYSAFKIYDFITVDKGNYDWNDDSTTVNRAHDNTSGAEDATAVLQSSMDWLLAPRTDFAQRHYDVSITPSKVQAYVNPKKRFVFRGTVRIKNEGHVPARGLMTVQAVNANNKVIGEYKKILTGLAPHNLDYNSYDEMFEIMMPGNIADGNYKLKITFKEARHDRLDEGFVTRGHIINVQKKGNYSTLSTFKGFKDVGKGSHLDNINNAAEIGIITGYENGTFKPSNTVSRLNAMMMMLRAMGVTPSKSATLPATVTDIKKGAYGYDVLATAYQYGLINIEKGNKMNAQGPMRRGEMAQALVKGFDLQGTSTVKFTDIGTPTGYAQYHNIQTLYHHRITTGKTASTYAPYDAVTRAQFATFIMRALENTSK